MEGFPPTAGLSVSRNLAEEAHPGEGDCGGALSPVTLRMANVPCHIDPTVGSEKGRGWLEEEGNGPWPQGAPRETGIFTSSWTIEVSNG